jgi:outer membrane protein OmpA-like peptidoglycan-associated protein
MRNILVLTILAGSISACAPNPKTLVVLLPNTDGSVGRVSVQTSAGAQELGAAQTATGASRADAPPIPAYALNDQKIAREFGDAVAAQPQPPQIFVLYFLTGGTQLTPESVTELSTINASIRARAFLDVEVVGHTDTVGSNAVNVPISQARAAIVRDLLVEQGVDINAITVSSHGENNPLVFTADNVDEPRNRRVEVMVR